METQRNKIEERISFILTYSKHPNTEAIIQSFSLFSIKELIQLLQFLETGKHDSIHTFLEEKRLEYLQILEEIKQKKKFFTLLEWRKKEQDDYKKEQISDDEFDF